MDEIAPDTEMTAADVARRLGVAKSTVADWLRSGKIRGQLVLGRTWVTTWGDVQATAKLPTPTPQRRKKSLDLPATPIDMTT